MTFERLPAQRVPDTALARLGGPAPVHTPGQLTFAGTTPTREELWPRFSPAIRDRVQERAGDRVEWWAAEHEGRLSGVVLGTKALMSLDPTVNAAGQPATQLTAMPLVERSFRSARVNGATPAGPVPGLSPHELSGSPRRVSEELAGFLGQLPARAQQLLQDPFQSSADPLQYDFYYYSSAGNDRLGGGKLYVWVYLTDRRSLTFGAGIGHGYRQHATVPTWELTCWRAEVARGVNG